MVWKGVSVSREHRRPLLAFVLVTLLCALVVGNSMSLASTTNRTLAAEVRGVVTGQPADDPVSGGVLATDDSPQGDVPLASSDPLLPWGTPTSEADSPQEPADDPRPPQSGSVEVTPQPGPAVSGPTLSGDAPPLVAPPLPESSPSPTAEPTAEPEPVVEPEPSPEPTVEPEPSPEPTVEPTPEPTPEPTLEPEPTPSPEPTVEPIPEPDAVLTFDDITSPTPEPDPTLEVVETTADAP